MTQQTTSENQSGFPTRFRNADKALQMFGHKQTHEWAAALHHGDPLADAVASEIKADKSKTTRAKFDLALEQGIDAVEEASPALIALFRDVDEIPDWVDFEYMDKGAAIYVRDREDTFLALTASLVSGYRSGEASKALTMSRRFIEYAPRRAEETLIWMLSAVKQGGMRRFGDGFKATMRVRLVHAFVREACLKNPSWRYEDWGMPVNQFDAARGICGEFTTVAFDARQKLGHPLNDEEMAAMMHLWRYIGLVMGIEEGLLPETVWDALKFAEFADLTATWIDDDSRTLANAVIAVSPNELRSEGKPVQAWLTEQVIHGYMRYFAGDEIADEYGLKNTVFKYLCDLKRPFVRRIHNRRVLAPGYDMQKAATEFIEETLQQNVQMVDDVVDMEEAGKNSERDRDRRTHQA